MIRSDELNNYNTPSHASPRTEAGHKCNNAEEQIRNISGLPVLPGTNSSTLLHLRVPTRGGSTFSAWHALQEPPRWRVQLPRRSSHLPQACEAWY